MATPLLTRCLLVLLLLRPLPAGAARPADSPGGKCLACHGAERPPMHRALSRALPVPPEGWTDCVRCHRGDRRTTRKELAHGGFLPAAAARHLLPGDGATARGKTILARSGCRRCHVSGGEGVLLAANLDSSVTALAPESLSRAIREPAAAMPDFRFGKEDAEALVSALLSNASGRGEGVEGPRTVHFSRAGEGERERHPFAVRCGPCHRALTERFGLVGGGTAGPDLSALFTPHHPGRARGGARWSEAAVPEWTRNPRAVRPGALMPPLRLREGEAEAAAALLRIPEGRVLPSLPPSGSRGGAESE